MSNSPDSTSKVPDEITKGLRLEWRNPHTLAPNPSNFRKHPTNQKVAFAELLDDVGWMGALLVNERTNRLIDGHLRRQEAIERNLPLVPCLIVNISEDKESEAMYFLDRITEMAKVDYEAERLLAEQFTTEQALLASLMETAETIDRGEIEEEEDKSDPMGLALMPGESYNYIVLLFDNDLDWVAAQAHFQIEKVIDPFGLKRIGVGRVINGGKYLARVVPRAEDL